MAWRKKAALGQGSVGFDCSGVTVFRLIDLLTYLQLCYFEREYAIRNFIELLASNEGYFASDRVPFRVSMSCMLPIYSGDESR